MEARPTVHQGRRVARAQSPQVTSLHNLSSLSNRSVHRDPRPRRTSRDHTQPAALLAAPVLYIGVGVNRLSTRPRECQEHDPSRYSQFTALFYIRGNLLCPRTTIKSGSSLSSPTDYKTLVESTSANNPDPTHPRIARVTLLPCNWRAFQPNYAVNVVLSASMAHQALETRTDWRSPCAVEQPARRNPAQWTRSSARVHSHWAFTLLRSLWTSPLVATGRCIGRGLPRGQYRPGQYRARIGRETVRSYIELYRRKKPLQ
jgi:hypothetical protein